MDVLFVVNSVFGARKAPGFRPWQLVRFDVARPRVIARGSAVDHAPIHFPLPGRSLIPRGLNFLRIKLFPGLPAREIEQALFDRVCVWQSRRLKDTPAVVHLWDHLPRTAAYWKRRGARVLVDLHMAHPRCYQPLVDGGRIDPASVGSLEDPAADACIALADLLVCPSDFVRDSLRPADRARAVVIPFGADPVPAAPPRGPRSGPLRVLFAGNINRRKGVPFLLDAWRALALPPDQAELVLCGRVFAEAGPWQRAAPPGVRFAGFQAEMAPWFADADLFVLPSLMEGSAKAVYEAMAHGLPAIVTPHTGSVVRDGHDGLVVEAADTPALAAALGRLIADPELRSRLGDNALATARAYSWEVYARGVAALYHTDARHTGAAPAEAEPEAEPKTFWRHFGPKPVRSKAKILVDQARLAVTTTGRRVDVSGNWLRFPFYHHVFEDERAGLADHLDQMRRYGEFIGLDDAVGLIESGTPLDGRYLCLSFDDGFRNTLTNGLPILAERQVPAAFFIVSGLVPADHRDCTPAHRGFFGPERRPVNFLTWDDCRTLLAAGMTIGSHSASHRKFITLSAPEARDELARSKAEIEAALGRDCAHFCCPWGKPGRDFKTERDPELARTLGYRSFLTTKYGSMQPGDSAYAIRRVGLIARFGGAQVRWALTR